MNIFWKSNVKKNNHIGIAVKDLAAVINFYKKLELDVEATLEDSPIVKFIEKRGGGIHHIAFEADEIKVVLKNAEHNNIQLIGRSPRKGAHNTEVAFLHPKSSHGVLLEICEDKKENI